MKKADQRLAPDPIQFVEVTPAAAPPVEACFEIAMRRSRRVFVRASFDGEALGRLVDVLEARG